MGWHSDSYTACQKVANKAEDYQVKRSGPLRRKTPLKPGGPLKRTRLKRISDKKRATIRRMKPERERYLKEMKWCAVTGKPATEIHEMACGAHRDGGYEDPAAWLAVSRDGHSRIQFWPLDRQMAVKLVADAKRFDLDKINKLRGRCDKAITLEDVAKWLRWT